MKWSPQKTLIAGGFSLTVLLTALTGMLSHHYTMQMRESNSQAQQSRQILNILTDIFAALSDADAGRRGFLLFQEKEELFRYQRAIKELYPKLAQLEQVAPNQRSKLTKLRNFIEQRIALGKKSLLGNHLQPSNLNFQLEIYHQNQQVRREILTSINRLKSEEKEQLKKWEQQSQRNFCIQLLIDSIGNILSFFIISMLFILLYRQFNLRQKTEQLQMKLAKEKEINDLKLRFFSLVSHEFRTPLSIILGSTQLLAQGISHGDPQKQQKNMERIQYSARLMTQLITDILTITRAETGKLEFNPSWLEIDSFCLNLITNLQLDTEQQSKIQFSSEGRCVYAWLDEKLLHSMLSNLLSNAIKYSPSISPVQLKVINEPNSIIFQVIDQGIGIPLESQSSLYEPFYRADNVGAVSGTGLGLTVVKNCVDLHHGQIMVVSNVGRGTTFGIQIPQQSSR